MLKLFLRKQLKNRFFYKLINFYQKYLVQLYFLYNVNVYNCVLQVDLPHRQHYTSIFAKNVKKIQSTGFILAKSEIKLKYYKRLARSNTGHILYLQANFLPSIKYLYLYGVKNFNYRQWVFFQKFLILVNPNILLLQHKKSYNTQYRPIKRIKRRVLHILLKGR